MEEETVEPTKETKITRIPLKKRIIINEELINQQEIELKNCRKEFQILSNKCKSMSHQISEEINNLKIQIFEKISAENTSLLRIIKSNINDNSHLKIQTLAINQEKFIIQKAICKMNQDIDLIEENIG